MLPVAVGVLFARRRERGDAPRHVNRLKVLVFGGALCRGAALASLLRRRSNGRKNDTPSSCVGVGRTGRIMTVGG
jgi:hypothetical protein